MAFLDHKELKIIEGVAAVPGDTNSVENPLQILNLLDTTGGISLAQDGWSPAIPPLESGGIWADSPLTSGRIPLVMQEGNVTETMRLIIAASSFTAVTKILASINVMAFNARAFWTDNAQIDPVYLEWYASCGKGPQYALIYNMDLKYEYGDSPTPMVEATLTIEREPYWRGVAPGANPKQWTSVVRNTRFSTSNANLVDSTNQLYYTGSLINRSEFNAGFGSLLTNDCMVIPAASIAGDAPALLVLGVQLLSAYNNIIIGKRTVNVTQRNSSTLIPANNTFNAPDGTLGTNATLANDTGAAKAAGSGTAQRVEISFATATNASRWYNSTSVGTNAINRFLGRWLVFLRCRQTTGSVGDISMYIRYGINGTSDSDGVKLNVVSPPVIAGTGNSTAWGLVYMGVITVPTYNTKAGVNSATAGLTSDGLQDQTAQNLILNLFASRSTGAGVLYLADLILVPVDEGNIALEASDSTLGSFSWYDNTGYLTHGNGDTFFINGTGAYTGGGLLAAYGPGIQLTPGVDNYLYTLNYDGSKQSSLSSTANFYLNIVPRWRGIRDV